MDEVRVTQCRPTFIFGSSLARYGRFMVRTLGRHLRCFALLLAVCLVPAASPGQQPGGQCTPAGSLVRLSGLSEASGLAVSRRTPGRLWTHNDSGQPVLVALDGRGAVTGQVQVSGAKVEDWEAVAVGACEAGSCVYIGDIGDNEAKRRRITVYQVPEPASSSGTATVSGAFHATYPDGAQDAEALLAAGDRLYVVTKGETGPAAIYRFPDKLQAGATVRLERVARLSGKTDVDSRLTDGSVSPDGAWIVLRSRSALTFYRAADLLGGQTRLVFTAPVTSLKEPQGEGVAFGADHTVFIAGEGGGKGQPGTFAHLTCALPKG